MLKAEAISVLTNHAYHKYDEMSHVSRLIVIESVIKYGPRLKCAESLDQRVQGFITGKYDVYDVLHDLIET